MTDNRDESVARQEALFRVNRARSDLNGAWDEEGICLRQLLEAQKKTAAAIKGFEEAIRAHERIVIEFS